MKGQNSSIDLASLFQDAKDFMDSACLRKFDDALQAISKRTKYSHYFYQGFLESSASIILLKDRLEAPNSDLFSVRDVFEANFLAFIDNLHALIDSFPYLVYLACPPTVGVEDKQKNWSPKFLNKFKGKMFYDAMISFSRDSNFKLLKELCNHGKHKYPIKLRNCVTDIYFENLDYYFSGLILCDPSKPVKDYMVAFNNQLLPKYFQLINLTHEDLKSRKITGPSLK